MNRAEARRVRDDTSAHDLWQSGGPALTLDALGAIVAVKERARDWVARRTRLWRGLTVAAVVAVALGSWAMGASVTAVATSAAVLSLCALVAIEVLYPTGSDGDLEFARRLRWLIERQDADLARIRTRMARAEPFALYLRTFGTETSSRTAGDALREEMDMRVTVEADATDPAQRHLIVSRGRIADRLAATIKDEWTVKRQLVAALARRLPVVCLGNIKLQDDKRAELLAAGVDEVTLVTTDWWPVFVEIEHAAAVTVVVLDAMTTHIARELDHLLARNRPFIVVETSDVRAGLGGNAGYAALVRHPSVRRVVIAKDDVAAFERTLAEALGTASAR